MKSSSQKLPAVLLAAALDPLLLGVAGDRAVQADRPVAHRAIGILDTGAGGQKLRIQRLRPLAPEGAAAAGALKQANIAIIDR